MNALLGRIKNIISHFGLSDSAFARQIGIGQSTIATMFQKDSIPKSDMLQRIVKEFDVNPTWLLTGEGEMISSYKLKTISGKSIPINENGLPKEGAVPYYDLDVMAHIAPNLEIDVQPSSFFFIPGYEDCFACFPVYGRSMEPVIMNGSVICVSKPLKGDIILWGSIYLVITPDHRVIKTVHPSQDHEKLILRSINPEYAGDTEIRKDSILAMYLVKGTLTRFEL